MTPNTVARTSTESVDFERTRLDDRTLADIGLNRSMIVAIADGAIADGPFANENRPLKAA